jgi:hypothetical protein
MQGSVGFYQYVIRRANLDGWYACDGNDVRDSINSEDQKPRAA